MAINAVGSGMDLPTMVSSLVSASRAPTEQRINRAGSAVNAKLSAVGQIKSGMTTLQTALEKLAKSADTPAHKATLPTNAGFSAAVSAGAVAGSYSVQVDSLATAHKLASAGYTSDAAVGNGTLNIAWGDEQNIAVEIAEGASLTAIASAVNKAAAGQGVTATVVTSDAGQHLVFTAMETGEANALRISAEGGDGGLLALTNGAGGSLATTVQASDARVRVDGLERRSASNSISDLVPGTVLQLSKVTAGAPEILRIDRDNDALSADLAGFVSAYNSVLGTLKSTSNYNAATKSASALTGDSMVRNLQQQLRSQFSSQVEAMKALGITADKEGVLSFSAGDFATSIAAEPAALSALFGKEGAYTTQLSKVMTDNLDSISGSLVLRTEGLNKQVSEFEKQLDALDVRMTRLSDLYTAQFTAMEMMVVQMQSNSSSLNSLLASNKD